MNPAALAAALKGDLANAIVAFTPGGIEKQEAAGQAAFVRSETLPKEMLHGCSREKLEAMGIKFGEDADDLFVSVQLPEGWTKRPTDHSMWSELLDEKGRKRAEIFYKAAFYDRNAHISLGRRYRVDTYNPCNEDGSPAEYGKHTHFLTVAKDGENIIFTGEVRGKDDYQLSGEHGKQATLWLDEHFPDWQDEMAYWD